ncbi:hypothetical protein [Nocardioides sp. zg-1230]|uniref:hypothetical protein n=1 Tax=Nocardioides sp. zg-1230 TaxID=2736601 RepID=UPI00155474FB|nr:hypothetical protein [Nocardioides sp. zg-1230]NPC40868.1 hypothetical protein [Nocardioides sp. zg-1230]NPC45244.1 hypothetical protein [Nocardioides sp. zg-1230]
MPSHRFAVRVLVAGALTGSSSVLVASPTTAADTVTTTTVALPDATVVDFRETIDIDVDVDSQDGSTPTDGTTTLYAMEAGSRTWVAVTTQDSASSDYLEVRPWMTTSYKVVYNGHTATSGADDSYDTSSSEPFTVQVRRTITYPSGGFEVEGRVKPRYGNRKIVIRVSRTQESGYVRYKAIRTDRRGRYSVTLPRRKGTWFWSFRVKGDERYLPTSFQWKTWVS